MSAVTACISNGSYLLISRQILLPQAIEMVSQLAIERINKMKITVNSIRKTYARPINGSFNLANPNTWKSNYFKNGGGIVELAVVGGVGFHVPTSKPGVIMNTAEEYALKLRNGVIKQLFTSYDGRALNPGNTDGGISPGYVIYMTYTVSLGGIHKKKFTPVSVTKA